jgi:opacity protein-like surface antigen
MRRFLLTSVTIMAMSPAGLGLAADLPTSTPPPAPPPPIFTHNWAGFYVGAHVGGGWNDISSNTANNSGVSQDHTTSNSSGVFGGAQIGYNWLPSPSWLLGAEADVSGSSLSGTLAGCTATGCAHSTPTDDAFGTVRARVGYVQGDWLFYGTGGFAWLDESTKRTITCTGALCPGASTASVLVGQVASASGTEPGWSAGGGIEWGFAPNWSVGVQYLHLQFDDIKRAYTYSLPTANRNSVSSQSIDTVRLGINYRFW